MTGRELRRPRDGRSWRIGTQSDVDWIAHATTIDRTITSAIPPVYEAYATVLVPGDASDRDAHDAALLDLLTGDPDATDWWLGYLDTGADDIVFHDVPMVRLYSGWNYVFVRAGSAQAATWRSNDVYSWRGALPDVIFPADRAWLVSFLWDDEWRCLGGSSDLVRAVCSDPVLHGRRVALGEDATPPGRASF